MLTSTDNLWTQFLEFMKKRCSEIEFQNWFAPIKAIKCGEEKLILQVPNIFVGEYLLDNYKEDMLAFLPKNMDGSLAVDFVIKEPKKTIKPQIPTIKKSSEEYEFNSQYTFENFIEGPSNQFVKSAALGVASRPGKSFNPLFIHGGVGLGKTHLLHGIGHYVKSKKKKLRVKYITTEAFINELVSHLRNRSISKMKQHFRSLDVLLIDDIQFLQNKNFEEELANTFESLINQNKQIVISSDKPPSQLKLSERIIARMEWGLVAHIGAPELETRVAIIQHKAAIKKVSIPDNVAFFIANHIYNNVRQLEGAINRLSAYCRLMRVEITEPIAEHLLKEMFEYKPKSIITVEVILRSVAKFFDVKVSDVKGERRNTKFARARQVAMYLAKELIDESLEKIASSFGGKAHSTIIYAHKKISYEIKTNKTRHRQIEMIKKNLED